MPEKKPVQMRLMGTQSDHGKKEYEPFVPGPNPKLAGFIKKHSTPYNPKIDKYDVKAFGRDIVVDKSAKPKAIYDMHSYWSKKHWAAIREYIRHYLPEKYYPKGMGLVLDCFSGSGMTGVAAMMEGRPCVLVDASPAAAFISHCYTHPVDPEELQASYDRMMTEEYPDEPKKHLKKITGKDIENLQQELDWLYETKCDRCGGPATTEYVVYSERYQCPRCGEIVALYDCPEVKVPYQVGSAKKQATELKSRRTCPHCLKKLGDPHKDIVISTRTRRFGAVPVLVKYSCHGECNPQQAERLHTDPRSTKKGRFFDEYDVSRLHFIESNDIPHWYPQRKMMDVDDDAKPWGDNWRPGRNFRSIAELYTKRNLWALAALVDASRRIAVGDAFRLAVVGMALGASRMNMYVPNNWSMQNRIMKGTYYLPQMSTAVNIRPQFVNKLAAIRKAQAALCERLAGDLCLDNSSALDLTIAPESIDYIFVDPPYMGKIQYGELNFVWESWIGAKGGWLAKEIIVNDTRGKTIHDWDRALRVVLSTCFACTKPGRWMSLCYHDTDPGTWTRVQNMLLDIGWEIHTVTVLDPIQKSMTQKSGEKVVRSDLVLNCRKSASAVEDKRDTAGDAAVSRRVHDILIEVLSSAGGQPRGKLWDIVLKRLLTRGEMAEHRFDNILAEVASKSESGRWFLKEEFESLSENDVRNEEAAGETLTRFARLRCTGVPVGLAAQLALDKPDLVADGLDEGAIEKYIKDHLLKTSDEKRAFKLGGRMKGCEFYDCLFFYLTRFLKGRPAGRMPRRNLAEFLEEYLVRFREADHWLYRPPSAAEAEGLKKSRQSGLGRRVRQLCAYLRGEGDFPKERIPDIKTLLAWLKHCANYGLADEGVLLYEKGGLMGRLNELAEDDRYDAEDYYAQCRRNASKVDSEDAGEEEADAGEKGEE